MIRTIALSKLKPSRRNVRRVTDQQADLQLKADIEARGVLQNLVGRPTTDIPVPVNPERRRVYCTTCPVTRDYNPGRLNIVYDQQTRIVREVKCG